MSLHARPLARAFASALMLTATAALAEDALKAGPQGPEQGPYRQQEWRVAITDSDGATPRLLEALLYRPAGEARRPLIVITHGTPRRAADRAGMRPNWAERSAAFFVAEGYVVLAPMRRGYGQSPGDPDDRPIGACSDRDYTDVGLRVGRQIIAIADYMRKQPFVDANRVILAGQSVGGFGSLAAASLAPPGVIAVINFAGGHGSRGPNNVCGEARLVEAAGRFGKSTRVPSIWLYAENDLFFRPELSRRMHAAYALGGMPTTIHILGSYGNDGHGFVRRADSATEWQPLMKEFLASLGTSPRPRAAPAPAPDKSRPMQRQLTPPSKDDDDE
jgi:dienelactone hydrolase